RLPRAPAGRRDHRSAVRVADRGVRHRARDGVRAAGVARPMARAARRSRRLYVGRSRRRADADRPAVRRAVRAARARGRRGRARGRGGVARRRPPDGLPARDPARGHARARERVHARARARNRRVRLRDLHRRQLADADRDHAAADRDQARAIRLPRRRGARPRDARRLVRDAAHDQRVERLARAPADGPPLMAAHAAHSRRDRPGEGEGSRVLRFVLIAVSLGFLTVILAVPVIAVLAGAFANGFGAYVDALTTPDTLAAIRLTLLTAAIVVPLNTLFGIAAAWAIAKFDFRGKQVLITLIDLPFSVSPVIAGLMFVLLFGSQGWFGPWLLQNDIQVVYALPG